MNYGHIDHDRLPISWPQHTYHGTPVEISSEILRPVLSRHLPDLRLCKLHIDVAWPIHPCERSHAPHDNYTGGSGRDQQEPRLTGAMGVQGTERETSSVEVCTTCAQNPPL